MKSISLDKLKRARFLNDFYQSSKSNEKLLALPALTVSFADVFAFILGFCLIFWQFAHPEPRQQLAFAGGGCFTQ